MNCAHLGVRKGVRRRVIVKFGLLFECNYQYKLNSNAAFLGVQLTGRLVSGRPRRVRRGLAIAIAARGLAVASLVWALRLVSPLSLSYSIMLAFVTLSVVVPFGFMF